MAAPYSSVTVSGYNANPPADDGSSVASNQVLWATIKSKLPDPLKTAIESVNTNIGTAFAKIVGGGNVATAAVDYTIQSSNQGGLVVATQPSITITTPDATSIGAPFVFAILNNSTGTITIAGNNPGSQQNVDGATSITVPAGNGLFLATDGSNWFTFGQNFTRAFPPPGASFKNLAIKVTGNTGLTCIADYVTTVNSSGQCQTTAVNSTINMATTGVDALDAGSIATSTFYAIWVIAKADGTTKCIASTSATAPTMPTGYTFKARVGWVRTASGVAQLIGTWQLGRRAQYVVGLAQCAAMPQIDTGTKGNIATPTWVAVSVSTLVPTTASEIFVSMGNIAGAAGTAILAPNNSYGAYNSTTNPPPFHPASTTNDDGAMCNLLLESSNIYWASNNNWSLWCSGWVDNI